MKTNSPPIWAGSGAAGTTDGRTVATIQKQQVKVSELLVVKTLTSEEAVDQYINTLSNKLKQIIKSNKHIEFIE